MNFRALEAAHGATQALKSAALERYTTREMINIIEEHKFDVDLVRGGIIAVARDTEEFEGGKQDIEAAKAAGLQIDDVEWIDEARLKEVYGLTSSFPAVRLTSGNTVWPLKFVTELYRLSTQLGPNLLLNVHTQAPVTSVVPAADNGRRWEVVTPRGSIHCSYVIHATNGYCSHLLPHMTGPSGIIPRRGQMVALRANAPKSIMGDSAFLSEDYQYWFPRPAKPDENPLVIIGGANADAPDRRYQTDDSILNQNASKALRDYVPSLQEDRYEKGRSPEMEWTGIMGDTELTEPFVGPVLDGSSDADKFKGQFMSAGYSGHGMPRAYACAEVVASMIACDIGRQTWVSPEWLPERYLTWNRVNTTETPL
ncbi:FAD dependent oxidoreductase [Mycena floridula]|nr:FAD dependent oxidoreductase [Mycena floridula]